MTAPRPRQAKVAVAIAIASLLAASIAYQNEYMCVKDWATTTPVATTPEIVAVASREGEGDGDAPGPSEPVAYREEINRRRQWKLRALDGGERLECRIFTLPVAADEGTSRSSSSSWSATIAAATDEDKAGTGTPKEQYVIHVHGLHHTGTGYLRQTLQEALNNEFPGGISPAASVHDSLRPYQHLFAEAKGDIARIRELYAKYHAPEEEGHHLQSVYPRFADRTKPFIRKEAKQTARSEGAIGYLADSCTVATDDDTGFLTDGSGLGRINDRLIGDILHREWSRYWDASAKFLIQKTPTMDVLFLERTKVLPTLHVIIVRHPMASNSWGIPTMGQAWSNVLSHVLGLLARDEVDWYAVVTYEALVQYHVTVVQELVEVVRSGMRRHGGGGTHISRTVAPVALDNGDAESNVEGRHLSRMTAMAARNDDHVESNTADLSVGIVKSPARQPRRRLHYHGKRNASSNKSQSSYLNPKTKSLSLWKECMSRALCQGNMKRLTEDVLPFFGYMSVLNKKHAGGPDSRVLVPLLSRPGTVVVRRVFGHVLFSSEGVALGEYRKSYRDTMEPPYANFKTPSQLLARMEEIRLQK